MNKCFTYGRCESDHGCGHGEMLHTIKGFDEPPGLVSLLDGPFGRVFDKNRQSLDDFFGCEYVCVDSSSISELQPSLRSARDVFGKSVDAEWKWILGQQQASLCNLLAPSKSMDRYASNLLLDSGSLVTGDVKQQVVTGDFSLANVLCAASKVESCPHAGIGKPQRVNMIQHFEANTHGLPSKGTLSWQAASSKDLAAAIPYRGSAYAENLGLPQFTFGGEVFTVRTALEDCIHTDTYKSPPLVSSLTWEEDRSLDSSGNEAKLTEDICSLIRTPPCELVTNIVEPMVIPTSLRQPSAHDRSFHLDGENTMLKASNKKRLDAKKPECEILGEALCHAQTRARVAEKLAEQAVKERDRFEHLLLREAWTSFTYKQHAQALELENRLLRLCLNMDIEVWTGGEVMYSMEQIANTCWKKPAQKRYPIQHSRGSPASNSQQDKSGKCGRSSRERFLLSCAIGLAFVLGLSITGAGLVIGWNMGWMLFS